MKLCSACLMGHKCRFDGSSRPHEKVLELAKKETLIPICPEQLGGLLIPRPSSEIVGGDGHDVLEGRARVVHQGDKDVTKHYVRGAKEVLGIAKMYNVTEAILKSHSPSCGIGQIYDGSFSKILKKGHGVTAALLKAHGIKVISEEDL